MRARGSNTGEPTPLADLKGEDPWQDLWFHSNPVFIEAPPVEPRHAWLWAQSRIISPTHARRGACAGQWRDALRFSAWRCASPARWM